MNPGFHLSCDENLSKGWGPPLRYDTEEEAYKAARTFGELHKRDVWVTRIGESIQPTELVDRYRPPT